MKKVLFRVLVVLTVLGLTASMAYASPMPDAQRKTGKVQITFWHNYGGSFEAPAIEKMVESYNASQDNVFVTAEYVGSVDEKLQAAIIANNAPDTALLSGNIVKQWANEGLLLDITDLLSGAGVSGEDFYANCWEESTYKGRSYALPFDTDCRALFYNIDMFKAAGLDPNDPPTTIEELDEYARKLTIKDDTGRYVQLGFVPWTGHGGILTWGFAFGGKLYDPETGLVTPSDPAFVNALAWEKTYAEEYGIESIDSFTLTTQGVISPFTSLKMAMIVGGSWEIAAYESIPGLNYNVCPIPTPTGDNFTTWAGGYQMIIPYNRSAKAEAAVDFMKYCCSGEGAMIFGEDGGWFCTNRSLNENLSWLQRDNRYQVFLVSLDTANCRPPVSQGEYFLEQLSMAQERAIHAGEDPQEVLDNVATRVNRRLAR